MGLIRKIALLDAATWAPVLLAWSFVLLLPFGRMSNLPVLIMAILGAVLLWRHGRQLATEGAGRYLGILFLCVWLPMLASVPDSVRIGKSLETVLLFPRLYLAGLFLLWIFREELARRRLLALGAGLMAFWVVDALVQAVTGTDLLGFEQKRERLQGIFGEENLTLGVALATLSPLLLEYVRRNMPAWVLAVAYFATLTVILLSGARTGWQIFALVTLGYFIVLSRGRDVSLRNWLAGALVVGLAAGAALYFSVPNFAARVDKSLYVFKGDYASVNAASSTRLTLWAGALRIMEHHPFNGAGVRAFRYAYPLYSPPGETLLYPDGAGGVVGEIHAHQLLLEVGSETGAIGLIGLAVFLALLLRIPAGRAPQAGAEYWPYWLAVGAWVFPIGTHLAFYSSYWSQVIWWLLPIALATCNRRESQPT